MSVSSAFDKVLRLVYKFAVASVVILVVMTEWIVKMSYIVAINVQLSHHIAVYLWSTGLRRDIRMETFLLQSKGLHSSTSTRSSVMFKFEGYVASASQVVAGIVQEINDVVYASLTRSSPRWASARRGHRKLTSLSPESHMNCSDLFQHDHKQRTHAAQCWL
jgi:hypothetical protein